MDDELERLRSENLSLRNYLHGAVSAGQFLAKLADDGSAVISQCATLLRRMQALPCVQNADRAKLERTARDALEIAEQFKVPQFSWPDLKEFPLPDGDA